VAIPLLLISSFIFYVISGVFYSLGGGDSVSDLIISGVADSNAADTFAKI